MTKFTFKISLQRLVTLAILLALGVVLANFAVGNQFLQVGPSFLINTFIGAVGGPIWSAITLALGDILHTVFFGKFGYFPGYTFSAFIAGLLYGFFFFKKKLDIKKWQDWLYTFLAFTVIILVNSVFFGTLWVSMLSHIPYHIALFGKARIFALIEIPIETIIVMLIVPPLQRVKSIAKVLLLDS